MNLGIVYSLSGRPQAALTEYAKAEVCLSASARSSLPCQALQQSGHGDEQPRTLGGCQSHCCKPAANSGWNWITFKWYLNAQESLGLAYMGSRDFDHAIQIFEEALALSEEQLIDISRRGHWQT